jgi:hypothetical protein
MHCDAAIISVLSHWSWMAHSPNIMASIQMLRQYQNCCKDIRRERYKDWPWDHRPVVCCKVLGPLTSGYEIVCLSIYNAPYSIKVSWRFGRTCSHLQVRRISQRRNQQEAGNNETDPHVGSYIAAFLAVCYLHHSVFLSLILLTWRWRQHVHVKHPLPCSKVHGVIACIVDLFGNVVITEKFRIWARVQTQDLDNWRAFWLQ